MSVLQRLDRSVQSCLRWLCIALFVVLALILLANVFIRRGNDLFIFLDARGWSTAAAVAKSLVPIT
ncbi:MAG: hypothetical protein LIP77_04650, partial [Planctomycetes bacterium]|nr:hypothetical protein [Planctomycetota bacterium]